MTNIRESLGEEKTGLEKAFFALRSDVKSFNDFKLSLKNSAKNNISDLLKNPDYLSVNEAHLAEIESARVLFGIEKSEVEPVTNVEEQF